MAYSNDRLTQITRALEDNLAARLSLGSIASLSVQVIAHFVGLDLATGPLAVLIFAFSVGIVTTTSVEWSGTRNGDVIFPSRTLLAIKGLTLLVLGLSIIQSVMYAFGRSVIRIFEGVVLLICFIVTLYAVVLFPPILRQVYRLRPTHNTHFIMGLPPDPPSVSFALSCLVLVTIAITWVVLLIPVFAEHLTLFYASARTSVAILLGSSLSLTLMVRQKNYWLTHR